MSAVLIFVSWEVRWFAQIVTAVPFPRRTEAGYSSDHMLSPCYCPSYLPSATLFAIVLVEGASPII